MLAKVRVKKDIMDSTSDALQIANVVLEVGLFLKLDSTGYYNNVRANLRLVAAWWTATIVSLTAFNVYSWLLTLLLVDVQPFSQESVSTAVVGYFALWGGLFWREKVSIHNKWQYLAQLYNSLLEAEPSKKNRYRKRELLENALALDVLQLEMWSHESYAELFYCALKESINKTVFDGSAEMICQSLSGVGIVRSEAKRHLLNYQQLLFSQSDRKSA